MHQAINYSIVVCFDSSGSIKCWPGAGFTKGLRLRLSQGLKSEFFVFAKSWTEMDFTKGDLAKSKLII